MELFYKAALHNSVIAAVIAKIFFKHFFGFLSISVQY
jgi:hypothetical protein